ncbi:MAG: hypothetical protein ABI603_06270 [Acidobacteriota bacterium]
MDVYLVPVGPDRYELYCEVPDEPADEAPPPDGFVGRLKARFTAILAEAERERRQGAAERPDERWYSRLRAQTMRWVAEAVAEQRLLWHLRRQSDACLCHPHDLDSAAAIGSLRRELRSDFEKHRFWLVIDALGFIASGALFLVPGPNIIAYYFAFRIVGHFLSMRGARQGLSVVAWTSDASVPLTDLRRAPDLPPDERVICVDAIAAALHLEHFTKFFERVSIPRTPNPEPGT